MCQWFLSPKKAKMDVFVWNECDFRTPESQNIRFEKKICDFSMFAKKIQTIFVKTKITKISHFWNFVAILPKNLKNTMRNVKKHRKGKILVSNNMYTTPGSSETNLFFDRSMFVRLNLCLYNILNEVFTYVPHCIYIYIHFFLYGIFWNVDFFLENFFHMDLLREWVNLRGEHFCMSKRNQ